MVKIWQLIGEFNQFFKVSDRSISTSTLKISNERSAINRRKYLGSPSDTDGPIRIARDLSELAGRGRAQFPHHATGRPHSRISDVSTRCSPQGERFRIILKLDANLLHQPFRLIFNQFQTRLVEKLKKRDFSMNKSRTVYCSNERAFASPSRSALSCHFALPVKGRGRLKTASR